MEEIVEGESLVDPIIGVTRGSLTFLIPFQRSKNVLHDPFRILCGAVRFALVVRNEPTELFGGHGGGAGGEVGKGFLDVRRWGLVGDGELSVEALEHCEVVCEGAH